jgi:large subunit ribosomal protein L18
MKTLKNKTVIKRNRLHKRIRARVSGTDMRPRLSVFRSNKFMYAQIIDDTLGKTLVAVNDAQEKTGNKIDRARGIGEKLAQLAKTSGITSVVFDRGGFRYTGRIAALAEGARAGGLQF